MGSADRVMLHFGQTLQINSNIYSWLLLGHNSLVWPEVGRRAYLRRVLSFGYKVTRLDYKVAQLGYKC
jgi:hypothetical protein